jgi:hypothetical protein
MDPSLGWDDGRRKVTRRPYSTITSGWSNSTGWPLLTMT